MGWGWLIVAAALPLTCAQAVCAQTVGALPMAPASKWTLEHADDSCALRRAFQAGDEQAVLQLRQLAPGDDFRVTVASSTLSRTQASPSVRFEPDDGDFQPSSAVLLGTRDNGGVVYTDSLRPAFLKAPAHARVEWPALDRDARERAITALMVDRIFERSIILQTGEMHEPMKAMRACLDELVARWGLDAAAQSTLSRPVQPENQRAWLERILASFPQDMVRRELSGEVYVRLVVGADGKPMSCIPDKGSAMLAYEEHACKAMMQHARFQPALDASGAPIASVWTTTISYRVSR